jgi:hypothetical protein
LRIPTSTDGQPAKRCESHTGSALSFGKRKSVPAWRPSAVLTRPAERIVSDESHFRQKECWHAKMLEKIGSSMSDSPPQVLELPSVSVKQKQATRLTHTS